MTVAGQIDSIRRTVSADGKLSSYTVSLFKL